MYPIAMKALLPSQINFLHGKHSHLNELESRKNQVGQFIAIWYDLLDDIGSIFNPLELCFSDRAKHLNETDTVVNRI